MKNTRFKILFSLMVSALCYSCATSIGQLGASNTISEGTLLTYTIDYKTPFHVKVKELTKDNISFKYYFGAKNEGGIIELPKTALNHGPDLKNYFSQNDWGETLILSDQTSVWMAKQVFKDLKNNKTVLIDTGNGKEEWMLSGEESWGVETNTGEDILITCLVFVDDDPNTFKEIWVLDDENNPLILSMDLDFHIKLNRVDF